MAVIYKDIDLLSQKTNISGTEKIVVSDTEFVTPSQIAGLVDVSSKQDTLVSGVNIKTINNQSILGEGNINISGGGGGDVTDVTLGGTSVVDGNGVAVLPAYPVVPTIVNNLTTDDPTKGLSAAQGVVLDDKVSQLEQNVTDLEATVDGIVPGTLEKIEYDSGDSYAYQINSNGFFIYNASNYLCCFVTITPGKSYVVRSSSYIAVLRELPDTSVHSNQQAKFATGFSGRILLQAGVDYTFTAPENGAYLFLFIKNVTPLPTLYEVLPGQEGLVEKVGNLEDVASELYLNEEISLGQYEGKATYPSGDTYITTDGSTRARFIPVQPGDNYILSCTSETFYCVLDTYSSPSAGDSVDYATGYSGNVILSANNPVKITIPEDGHFLCVFTKRTTIDTGMSVTKVMFVTDALEGSFEKLKTLDAIASETHGKDILVFRGEYLRADYGDTQNSPYFSTSDFINVSGCTRIVMSYAGETQSACPVAFYDKNKVYLSCVYNVKGSIELFEYNVPSGAKFIRVCSQNTNDDFLLTLYGKEFADDNDFGIFPNPFVEVGGFTRKVVVSSADAPSDLPVVRCAGSFAKNGNIVYTIATCTPSGADSGKRKSVFKAFNVAAEETTATSIVFDGGDGAYMNEVVFYDANGVLGTAGTIYAFAIYHADYTKLYVNETDPDDLDFVYKTSTDGGETWSVETSLKSLLPDGFLSVGCSPANPIVLENGTFCLAGFFMKNQGTGVSKYRSGLITKKVGYNWKAIPLDIDSTNIGENETTIVEYGNNSVMLNVRSNYNVYSRAIYYTSEILPGEDFVFHRHPSWRTMPVPDSHLCEGSITRFDGLYYYSSVDFTMKPDRTRQNILLYVSPDANKWYPLLYLFIGTTKGYSHLLAQGNNLYVMFESENSTIDYADITTRVNALLSGGMSTILNHTPDWRLLQVAKNREELA